MTPHRAVAGDIALSAGRKGFLNLLGSRSAFGAGGNTGGGYCLQQRDAYATVLEEVIRCQVNDEPVTTYTAGQSFSELPGDIHHVSANASETAPAKLLAVFVADTNEVNLTTPLGN